MFELPEGTQVETETDRLGGNGPKESGLYNLKLEMMYIMKSKGGAMGVVLNFVCPDKSTYRETVYISSGDDKGNKFTYTDKTSKEEVALPGYAFIDSLCKLLVGSGLSKQETVSKKVGVYNFDAKAEVPTDVEVFTDLLGNTVTAGILLNIEDKRKNMAGPGEKANYQPTGETVERNEIDKLFHAESGKTIGEMVAKADTAVFKGKWDEKNTGKSRNNAKGAKAMAKANPAGAEGAAASDGGLFK